MKDEFEFDFWVAGIKALLYAKRCKSICKNDLLRHSWIYRKYMEENDFLKGLAEMISFSPEYLERRTMDMCVKRKKLDQ